MCCVIQAIEKQQRGQLHGGEPRGFKTHWKDNVGSRRHRYLPKTRELPTIRWRLPAVQPRGWLDPRHLFCGCSIPSHRDASSPGVRLLVRRARQSGMTCVTGGYMVSLSWISSPWLSLFANNGQGLELLAMHTDQVISTPRKKHCA